jgi:hypothetical protein
MFFIGTVQFLCADTCTPSVPIFKCELIENIQNLFWVAFIFTKNISEIGFLRANYIMINIIANFLKKKQILRIIIHELY